MNTTEIASGALSATVSVAERSKPFVLEHPILVIFILAVVLLGGWTAFTFWTDSKVWGMRMAVFRAIGYFVLGLTVLVVLIFASEGNQLLW